MREFAFAGIIPVVIGLALVHKGIERWTHVRSIEQVPQERLVEVDSPGVVGLTGTVEPVDDERVHDPLTDQEGVVAGWKVEYYDHEDRSGWHPVAEGFDSVPFYLDDGSDRILVTPGTRADPEDWHYSERTYSGVGDSVSLEGAVVDFEAFPVTHEVDRLDETPPAVERFEREVDAVRERTEDASLVQGGTNDHDRRYFGAVIEAGQEVYLVGTVKPREPDEWEDGRRLRPAVALVRSAKDDPFLLSERSPSELLDAANDGRRTMLLGACAVLLGLGLLSGVIPLASYIEQLPYGERLVESA